MAKVEMVSLKTKVKDKFKKRDFAIAHANKVLSLSNPQWILDDAKWKWNKVELAKV